MRTYYTIKTLCLVANVNESNYYKWLQNREIDKDINIKSKIIEIYNESDKTYGYRRILQKLKNDGYAIGETKLRRLLFELEMQSEIRRKKKHKNYLKIKEKKYIKPNLLNQDFSTTSPNQKYVADITEIDSQEKTVYVATITDLFNNEPVVQSFSYSPNKNLTIDAINKLYKKRNIKDAIIHSDRGVQYSNKDYIEILKNFEVKQSMSRTGCPYDNSPAENYFSILKTEKIHRLKEKLEDIDAVKTVVTEYNRFYCETRISTVLGGITPNQYMRIYEMGLCPKPQGSKAKA